MTTNTTLLNLAKSEAADLYQTTRTDNNGNWDILEGQVKKSNVSTLAPTAADDSSEGYSIGSIWVRTVGPVGYICTLADVGAAVWKQAYPIVAPGAAFDFGAFECRALTFQSDIATGAGAPLVVASTDRVANLHAANSDALNGLADTAFVKKTDFTAKGSIQVASGANTPANFAAGTDGQVLAAHASETQGIIWLDRIPGLYYNAVINGQFQINQRAVAAYTSATTPANSDDTYTIDQWCTLSDGNDIADESQELTIVPPGAPSCLKLEVETANKKFGKIFFLENKDALKFAGKSVSLQLKARTTTGKAIRNIRAAVLSWASTADTLTSDVVNAWSNEGTNPTLVANWTAENVAANLALVADTWTTYKIENIAIDTASMKNIAVFIWCDDTDPAVDDLLYLGDVQLNEGAVCLPFMPRSFEENILKCKRFFQKSYAYATAPGAASQPGFVRTIVLAVATANAAGWLLVNPPFPVVFHHPPALSLYTWAGTLGSWFIGDQDRASVGIDVGVTGFGVANNTGGAITPPLGTCYGHWVASAEL